MNFPISRHSSLAEARREAQTANQQQHQPLIDSTADGIGPPGRAEVVRLPEKKKRACCSLQWFSPLNSAQLPKIYRPHFPSPSFAGFCPNRRRYRAIFALRNPTVFSVDFFSNFNFSVYWTAPRPVCPPVAAPTTAMNWLSNWDANWGHWKARTSRWSGQSPTWGTQRATIAPIGFVNIIIKLF